MELALSLKPFSFLDRTPKINEDMGFRMEANNGGAPDPPLQLRLLPSSPVPLRISLPCPTTMGRSFVPVVSEPGSSDGSGKALDVNQPPSAAEDGGDRAALSSPKSAVSSFPVVRTERTISRASDEEEDSIQCRKKLRLSKEQSAFLEESFKEHSTLNPKQKLALAKRLSLRPRQVEVWFQNRRASVKWDRTKLKQTEVDCEYLKKICEKLTEENRRLQKELQDLRTLKAQPFCMQLPATTLTVCPSCERGRHHRR